jgi:hypothetical protein
MAVHLGFIKQYFKQEFHNLKKLIMKWMSLLLLFILSALCGYSQNTKTKKLPETEEQYHTKKVRRDSVAKAHYWITKIWEKKQLYYQKLSLNTTNPRKQKIYSDSSTHFMRLISQRVIATRHQIQKIGYDKKPAH